MAEIEVKAKLNNKEVIVKKLEDLGCTLSDPVTQEDSIYVQKDVTKRTFDPSRGVLRIRKQGAKILFTLKKDRKNELDCIEHETTVENGTELEKIILELDFEPYVRVKKTRQKTKYAEYEICIDEVVGLGSFIEVEKISEEDGAIVQRELFDFLKTLGVSENDRVLRGYDTLVYEKMQAENRT